MCLGAFVVIYEYADIHRAAQDLILLTYLFPAEVKQDNSALVQLWHYKQVSFSWSIKCYVFPDFVLFVCNFTI